MVCSSKPVKPEELESVKPLLDPPHAAFQGFSLSIATREPRNKTMMTPTNLVAFLSLAIFSSSPPHSDCSVAPHEQHAFDTDFVPRCRLSAKPSMCGSTGEDEGALEDMVPGYDL